MKKILLPLALIIIPIVVYAAVFVADITVGWKENDPSEFTSKYIVYQNRPPATNYVPVVTVVGTNIAKIRVTSSGTYLFKVSAVNANGESPLSDAVQVPATNVTSKTPSNVNVISINFQ